MQRAIRISHDVVKQPEKPEAAKEKREKRTKKL